MRGKKKDYYEDDLEYNDGDYEDDGYDKPKAKVRAKQGGGKAKAGSGKGERGREVKHVKQDKTTSGGTKVNIAVVGAFISTLGSIVIFMGQPVGAVGHILGNILVIVGVIRLKGAGSKVVEVQSNQSSRGNKYEPRDRKKPVRGIEQEEEYGDEDDDMVVDVKPVRGRATTKSRAGTRAKSEPQTETEGGQEEQPRRGSVRRVKPEKVQTGTEKAKFSPKFCPECGESREGNRTAVCVACEFDIKGHAKMDYHYFCMSCGEEDECECVVRRLS
jgi:hypothetical protein